MENQNPYYISELRKAVIQFLCILLGIVLFEVSLLYLFTIAISRDSITYYAMQQISGIDWKSEKENLSELRITRSEVLAIIHDEDMDRIIKDTTYYGILYNLSLISENKIDKKNITTSIENIVSKYIPSRSQSEQEKIGGYIIYISGISSYISYADQKKNDRIFMKGATDMEIDFALAFISIIYSKKMLILFLAAIILLILTVYIISHWNFLYANDSICKPIILSNIVLFAMYYNSSRVNNIPFLYYAERTCMWVSVTFILIGVITQIWGPAIYKKWLYFKFYKLTSTCRQK